MSKGENIERERRLHKSLESLDTGEGIEVATSSPLFVGKVKAHFFYSNNFPDIEINTLNGKRSIKVSVSSVEDDNRELLHFLFAKTRTK
jgi:hypothetical protein